MLELVFWDVQHGSASYVKTPNGTKFAIDLGTGAYKASDATFSPLQHLYRYGIRQLDGVLITHPHRDHLDDIGNFNLLSPRVLYRPRHLSPNDIRSGNRAEDGEIMNQYICIDANYRKALVDSLGKSIDPFDSRNNGGVVWQIFKTPGCNTSNLNNHSLVSVISYAASKIIIPGDNEAASWKILLEDPAFTTAIVGTDILVAPHHGRESGFYDDLFNYIAPKLVSYPMDLPGALPLQISTGPGVVAGKFTTEIPGSPRIVSASQPEAMGLLSYNSGTTPKTDLLSTLKVSNAEI